MEKFYKMGIDDLNFKRLEYTQDTEWETILCPKFKDHQRNGNRIGELKISTVAYNSNDFLWTFLDWMLNEKVVDIFLKYKITGYNLEPVRILESGSSSNIYELVVNGQGGKADSRSGIIVKESCEYCGMKIYSAFENGIWINETNWDGSEIFTIEGYPSYYMVNERLKEIILKHKLTGVNLICTQDLKWNPFFYKP